MKKYYFVELKNVKPYIENGLEINMYGLIVKEYNNSCDILFYNPKNSGDYIVINIKNTDFILTKEKLSEVLQRETEEKLDSILSKAKDKFEPVLINDYDKVELLVEDKKYTQYDVHKGDTGCVMDSNAIDNYILVDFSWVNENGNYFGDLIPAKISDLKVID